jgi:hypothetical protein
MKIATSFLASLVFIGALGAVNAANGADGILYKQELTPGSYCHLKFPAMREQTLSWDHPVLKDASDGDIIDFYGPCDEDPVGKDQVWQQKLDRWHHWRRSYD